MQRFYLAELERVKNLQNKSDKLLHLNNIIRSLQQTISISLLQVVTNLVDSYGDDITGFIDRYQKPNDSLPREIIEKSLPLLNSIQTTSYFSSWYDQKEKSGLSRRLLEWIEFRNNVFSHGSISKEDIEIWSIKQMVLVNDLLEGMSILVPKVNKNAFLIDIYNEEIYVDFPLLYNNKCIVISSVVSKKGLFKLNLQTLDWDEKLRITVDIFDDNILNNKNLSPSPRFTWSSQIVGGEDNSFCHNIPKRQTTNFVGRQPEIEILKEWMCDFDYRSCIIYGDGGFGKTTFLLEFFNSLFEGEISLNIKIPFIISYYTAKMTRWGSEGLIYYKGVSSLVEDALREVLYAIEERLDKGWFESSGRSLVNKIESELSKQGMSRDDVLIIIDNAETLASTKDEINDLGQFLELISKKVGRLIITSRRKEFLAAKPIPISSLTEADSLSLLRKSALEYGAKAISQSGDSGLKKILRTLHYKPLLIDSLVRYISRAQCSIDDAIEQVYKKSSDELLEFLYEDAWIRIGESDQDVFMVLVTLSCPIDSFSVGYTCQELEIQHAEFQSSLDETYFVNLTNYGNRYEIEIIELAKKFFYSQKNKLSSERLEKINRVAELVNRRALEKAEIEKAYKDDRVTEAYRTEYAKAAKISVDRNRINDAIDNYEYALIEDPVNSYLFERYAFFLISKTSNKDKAKELILKALDIDPNNPEALLTGAIIFYRFLDLEKGDELILKAEKNGKPHSYCYVRKAMSRYHKARKEDDKMKALKYLDEAVQFINIADDSLSKNDSYYAKNKNTIIEYKNVKIPRQIYFFKNKK
ncbi:AAA family ATPase [Dickeya zeae]|uniref:AAA family ATPase n=1 Tax=Dickeya zeae TaxID=204042 RepID=UPI002098086A|nr:AAA family ATPase [Dickeya zeae]MCO7262929.1 AAA family ATPase [Dickeya zeae]